MTPAEQEIVLNGGCPEGARVIAHCVPTRAFRVIAMPGDKVFRVEQLQSNTWKWVTLSTHAGDDEFESYGPALQDAIDAQEKFKDKIRRAQIAQRQAERQAEKEHGSTVH